MFKPSKMISLLLAVFMSVGGLPAAVSASDDADEIISSDYEVIEPEEIRFTESVSYDAPVLYSMMPLKERSRRIYLDGYLPSELEEFPLETLVEKINEADGGSQLITVDSVVAWADLSAEVADDYHLPAEDDTIDLSAADSYNKWSDYSKRIELIVGETADQFNLKNIRYTVWVYVNYTADMLLDVSAAASDHTELELTNTYISSSNVWIDDEAVPAMRVYGYIYEDNWPEDSRFYVGLTLGQMFQDTGLTAEFYEGLYASEDAIPADAVEITDTILEPDLTTGGYLLDLTKSYRDTPLTVVFRRDGETIEVVPLYIYLRREAVTLDAADCLYMDDENGGRRRLVSYYPYDDYENETRVHIYEMRQDPFSGGESYPTDGSYYVSLELYDPREEENNYDYGINNVKRAVLGNYTSAEDILALDEDADIKEQLFSYSYYDGYKADFGSGSVTFSVLSQEDKVYRITLKTIEYQRDDQDDPLSEDTYFRVNGALVSDGYGDKRSLQAYTMPYNADGYYHNGYQTVLLLDNGSPVANEQSFYPTFYADNRIHVFASHDLQSGERQESGITSHTFKSGSIIKYSASAEDGNHLKNYWVTYLTQQQGPSLFINGINDEERYVTVGGEKMYQREMFIIEEYGSYHDIFFTNIGNQDMKGMYVKLSDDAQNVKLDEYWTITDNSTLSPFDKTSSSDKLQNVGKVRLLADVDENGNTLYGEISGTLVIGYTGEDSSDETMTAAETGKGEEYRIALTGIAASPQVTTGFLADAVQYVPYSQLIMTNNMYGNNSVKFDITDGELPAGLRLLKNGEIYGVPTEVGEFTFEAEITFKGKVYDREITDTREFTIRVLDNTDENVFWTNDPDNQGYEITGDENDDGYVGTIVPGHEILRHVWVNDDSYVTVDINDFVVDAYDLELFWSEGIYGDFVKFFLDGDLLDPGVDYTSEEGSTKINIQSQTFRNAGEGHHTIAAEFRANKSDDGLMKRTSQNVYVHNVEGGTPGGNTGTTTPDSSYFEDLLNDLRKYRDVILNNEEEEDEPIESESVESESQHSITFVQGEGGRISSSYMQAMEGTLVTLTVTPFAGFRMKTIEADSEIPVYLTKVTDSEYTFTMPGAAVEVRVSFEDTEEDVLTELPFGDVPKSEWFFDSIAYVYSKGLMKGTGADMFAPNAPTSRAMIVTVLYRMADEPAVSSAASFEDVTDGSYYADAVAWAAETGIMEGYSAARFGADDSVTREQMATILYRYAAYTGRDTGAANMLINYADADQISAYAVAAMEWANAEGLILGTTETTLNPTGEATRAQIAAILARFRRGE